MIPSDIAVVDDVGSLTRAELADRVAALAAALAAAGVRTGDRVAWMMHNRAEVVIVAQAVRALRAVVVPLSYRSPAVEVARLLAVAAPATVVVEDDTAAVVAAAGATAVLNVDRPPAGPADGRAGDDGGGDAPETRFGAGASLVFTSGTTGSPKGALRTRGHRPLAERIATGLGFRTGSRYLAAGPLYHSGPWTCAFMALNRAGTVIVSRRLGPAQWLATARAHAVTSTFVTPTVLRRLVDEVERGAPAPATLENVIVSGEPFPPELKRRAVSAFGPCVLDCYGSTELGPVAVMPGPELLSRPTSCGRPFAGVEIAAFDGDRRLPPGELGLLRVRTPLAFDGYVRSAGDPGGSVPAWASVGDLGYLDRDGYLHLVDRADDMIISGGVNVFPADVEAVVLEHPAIRRCVVVGLPDPHWGQVVGAVVVADARLDLAGLREWMRGRIADDKRPRRLLLVEDLPTTVTEKASRRLARERLLGERAGLGG